MSAPTIVRSLVCRRDVAISCRCLRTVQAHSADPIRFVLHEDGSLDDEARAQLMDGLPGAEIVSRREADERMGELLRSHPSCAAFRKRTIWGLKLLDICMLHDGDTFYVDGDVRCFRAFRGLFTGATASAGPVFFHDHHWQAYSLRPWHLLKPGLAVAASINTGLTVVGRSHFDPGFMDWFLRRHAHPVVPAWIEPTAWAALAWRTGARTLDPRQFPQLYPDARISSETLGAHFLSAYRSLFKAEFEDGISAGAGAGTAAVRLLPVRRLGPVGLAISQYRRACENRAALKKLGEVPIERHPNHNV